MKKQENQLLNIVLNIVAPALILSYLADDKYLGATLGFVVALAFPLGYGIYEFSRSKSFNLFSGLGILNVVLSGGIGLLKIDTYWLAVKEAAIPGVIGLIIIASLKTKYPLVKTLLYNDTVMDTERVNQVLEEKGSMGAFNKLLTQATMMLAATFFLSAILNYTLAKWIVVSPTGTAAFNQELGKMTALSYPVILLPSMAMMIATLLFLIHGITKLTQLKLEEILKKPNSGQ